MMQMLRRSLQSRPIKPSVHHCQCSHICPNVRKCPGRAQLGNVARAGNPACSGGRKAAKDCSQEGASAVTAVLASSASGQRSGSEVRCTPGRNVVYLGPLGLMELHMNRLHTKCPFTYEVEVRTVMCKHSPRELHLCASSLARTC